jgi:hypothetical protein
MASTSDGDGVRVDIEGERRVEVGLVGLVGSGGVWLMNPWRQRASSQSQP